MAVDYAAVCIRETLIKSKGNVTVAQSMLVELAKTDERLLLALTQPYLTGIVAHAVGRLIRNVKTDPVTKQETRPRQQSGQQKRATVLESVISEALSGGSNVVTSVKPAIKQQAKPVSVAPASLDNLFAQLAKNFEAPAKDGKPHIPGKASKEHVAALHTIAKHTFRAGDKKK